MAKTYRPRKDREAAKPFSIRLTASEKQLLLAKAGLLGDQRVAARSEIEADLREFAPSVSIDTALTESGKLLTASPSKGSR